MLLLNKLFIFLTFLFFISFTFALELGAKPAEIDISTFVDEENCQNIELSSSGDVGLVRVSSFWSDEQSRTLTEFTRDSSELEIELDYVSYFTLNGKEVFNFCVKSKEEGKFYGVILFDAEYSNIILGVWVNIDSYKSESKSSSLGGITGFSFNESSISNTIFLQLAFTFILVILLIYLFIKSRRKIYL